MMNIAKKTKIIICLIAILLVIIIILSVINNYMTQVSVLVYPNNASIKIGNNTLSTGNNKILPGKYTVEVQAPGFKTYSKEEELKPWTKFDLNISLESVDNSNQSNLSEKDSLLKDGIQSRIYGDYMKKMQSKYPILNSLPVTDTAQDKKYRIYPVLDNDSLSKIVIEVNDFCSKDKFNTYKDMALTKLNEIERNADKKYNTVFKSNC